MPQRTGTTSNLMRPFVVLALPGMYLLYKYNQYRQQQMETARRRVTERELMHLNTKIKRSSKEGIFLSNNIWSKELDIDQIKHKLWGNSDACRVADCGVRTYANDDKCRRALVDIPPKPDPLCPKICARRKPKKKGLMYKLKLKIVEGGSNFGTPFRFLRCKSEKEICKKKKTKETALQVPAPKPKPPPIPKPRPGLQVSVLGADTAVGQYIALLLKQCPPIKKLRLYEAIDFCCRDCRNRDLCNVVQDLQHIDTNCTCEAFFCSCGDLERCLQSTDIVLILDNACITPDMPLDKRFCCQAPIVKQYADSIASECPAAFIIVCATPIDCMVPLIAETMKETGWYDPRKLLGSLAVPEMRASTLAARALSLEPWCTRVPCVCGTEGEAIVPLFSKAVEYFEFPKRNAELMTAAVRGAPASMARSDGNSVKAAELSEAHAIAGLVSSVAYALLCQDIPRVSGFVETDSSQVISPARFIGNTVELHGNGIERSLGLPTLSESEIVAVDRALVQLCHKMKYVQGWYRKYLISSKRLDARQHYFFTPHSFDRYLAIETLLNHKGICKKFDFPPMSDFEEHYMNVALGQDKLLNKLEENEPELATSPEEECVICVNAKATMQTSPCGHRVVCRRCFVKTIQMAVSQRLLPLRCVICRAKILRLRQAPRLVTSKSWQVSSSSGKSWGVPGSVSSYSVGARSVPASASLYSVTSGESSLSGVSSVSSNSGGTVPPCSKKLCGGAKCGGACLGAVPRPQTAATPPKPRQPASNSLRRSQHHSMKVRLQEYQVQSYTGPRAGEPSARLPPIREFQREFREGRRENASATASASTRIRCAQKIVTQLETSPQKESTHFFRPLKPSNKDDPPKSGDQSKETERKKDNPKTKPKKDDKNKKEEDKQDDKNKKEESNDNRKNELAERKKEEKMRLKAEKEAKKEAKLQAKEEERQAKLLAKEEERQAKLLAKEEKKKAKKEAKLAAQAEKEKNK